MNIDGSKIKALRKARGISRVDLAGAADLGERRICQIEDCGKASNLNMNIAKAIVRKLGVRINDIKWGEL